MDEYQAQYNVQSALQQQELDAQTSMNAPAMIAQQRDMQTNLLQQLDPEQDIEYLKLLLQGKKMNASCKSKYNYECIKRNCDS